MNLAKAKAKQSWLIVELGHMFVWHVGKEDFECSIERMCPLCGIAAVVKLPKPLLDAQPDKTTHVCHPAFGGCNHGFEVTS